MSSINDVKPGMIGFGPLANGTVTALEAIGSWILGQSSDIGEFSAAHVYVVADNTVSPFPTCIEAMPSGAREFSIVDRWDERYAYIMPPEDYPGQALDAAAIARAMIGTPYSFASYAALAAWRFGWRTQKLEAWINRRKPAQEVDTHWALMQGQEHKVTLPEEAICSVLADQAWALTGKQVMPHGTPHQVVTPGALAGALIKMPGAQWLWPGQE